jgi:hypothetical protein
MKKRSGAERLCGLWGDARMTHAHAVGSCSCVYLSLWAKSAVYCIVDVPCFTYPVCGRTLRLSSPPLL